MDIANFLRVTLKKQGVRYNLIAVLFIIAPQSETFFNLLEICLLLVCSLTLLPLSKGRLPNLT